MVKLEDTGQSSAGTIAPAAKKKFTKKQTCRKSTGGRPPRIQLTTKAQRVAAQRIRKKTEEEEEEERRAHPEGLSVREEMQREEEEERRRKAEEEEDERLERERRLCATPEYDSEGNMYYHEGMDAYDSDGNGWDETYLYGEGDGIPPRSDAEDAWYAGRYDSSASGGSVFYLL